jgi:hypothetical protein
VTPAERELEVVTDLRLDLLRQLHEIRFFEQAVQRLCEQAWSGSRTRSVRASRGERDRQSASAPMARVITG